MDAKELGGLADRLSKVRQDRLAADKIAASLRSEESRLKQLLISEMEEKDLAAIGGKSVVINRKLKTRYYATDWSELYGFISENDAFDLLHKRLTAAAIEQRLADDVHVPGVGSMEYSDITYSNPKS